MFNPYGSISPNQTTLWHPEPKTRGTYSILSSCLITVGLCVWTALHLNIPEYGSSKQMWRKIGWLSVGLLAPELVRF
ncbi:hypothetical protein GQ44DRAFT_55400 [Phaeosphaeriaceae sp. PMI808]|nr:hypothetical protein GQ44DRAFT_55400 [Phaeosphaeriaceae sp. PMI808]